LAPIWSGLGADVPSCIVWCVCVFLIYDVVYNMFVMARVLVLFLCVLCYCTFMCICVLLRSKEVPCLYGLLLSDESDDGSLYFLLLSAVSEEMECYVVSCCNDKYDSGPCVLSCCCCLP